MENELCIVYIKTDEQNRIVSVKSNVFLQKTEGWTKIDQGYGYRFRLANGNYFPKPIWDEHGNRRYITAPVTDDTERKAIRVYEREGKKWGIYERTQEEMDADWVEPEPRPTDSERIAAIENQLAAYEAAYTEGVNEA